jgi:hypothetical protein
MRPTAIPSPSITTQYGGSWLNATSIELRRLLKFGGQVNF